MLFGFLRVSGTLDNQQAFICRQLQDSRCVSFRAERYYAFKESGHCLFGLSFSLTPNSVSSIKVYFQLISQVKFQIKMSSKALCIKTRSQHQNNLLDLRTFQFWCRNKRESCAHLLLLKINKNQSLEIALWFVKQLNYFL